MPMPGKGANVRQMCHVTVGLANGVAYEDVQVEATTPEQFLTRINNMAPDEEVPLRKRKHVGKGTYHMAKGEDGSEWPVEDVWVQDVTYHVLAGDIVGVNA